MRLVQRPKEGTTPTLPLWLSRDVPHERELARELLDAMGREKSLQYLLHLHDLEETRRQKRFKRYFTTILSCLGFTLVVALIIIGCITSFFSEYVTRDTCKTIVRVCLPLIWGCNGIVHLFNFWMIIGKRKYPMFSSAVQQNVITSLLDHTDSPLVADALARATTYFKGDRDRLFDGLAQALFLLPNDPDALTQTARHALWLRLSPAHDLSYAGEKERLPALRTAIAAYFARTGEPTRPSKVGEFWAGLAAKGERR